MTLTQALAHTAGSLCTFLTLGELLRVSNVAVVLRRMLDEWGYLWQAHLAAFRKTHARTLWNAGITRAGIQRRRRDGRLVRLTPRERQRVCAVNQNVPKSVLLEFLVLMNAPLRASLRRQRGTDVMFSYPSGICRDCCGVGRPLVWDQKCYACFSRDDSEMSVTEANEIGVTASLRATLPCRGVRRGFGCRKLYKRSRIETLLHS